MLNEPRRSEAMAACWHASWLAMLAMRRRSRSRCSGVLSCNRTQLLSLSLRSLRYHFIVRLTLTSSHPWPQQARQAASGIPHDGMGSRCVHRCLTQIHAPSVYVVHAGMADTKRWPRGCRFYRPPAATPLSLSPNGDFQPPRWPESIDPDGHWLGLDVPSTCTACGAIGGATETHGDLW